MADESHAACEQAGRRLLGGIQPGIRELTAEGQAVGLFPTLLSRSRRPGRGRPTVDLPHFSRPENWLALVSLRIPLAARRHLRYGAGESFGIQKTSAVFDKSLMR